MLTLKEFLDDNAHRCYPFADVNNVPTDLIVDMHLLVTNNVSSDSLTINEVAITDSNIRITISNDGAILGTLLACALPTKDYQTVACKLVNDEEQVIIEGSITFGLVEALHQKTGSYEAGKLFEGCVIPVTEWCTGLVINDVLYTGVVTLNIGDGLKVNTTEDGIINIYTDNYAIPATNNIIDDEKIISDVLEQHAAGFITTINGVKPVEGNINITSLSDTLTIGDNTGAITISYTNGKLCADAPIEQDDTIVTQIEQLFDNLTALNERAGALDASIQTLDTNLNAVSSQMAMIQ